MLKIVDNYMGLIPLWGHIMKNKFREDMTSDFLPKKRRQEIPDIEKWKRTKTTVKKKNPFKDVRCPRYGGTHMYNGHQVTLTNTCPLDNFLIYIIYMIYNLV